MKTKFRRLVSILSAMVLMVCCAVPAFAYHSINNSDTMSQFIISSLQKCNEFYGYTPTDYIAFYDSGYNLYSLAFLVPNSNEKFLLDDNSPNLNAYISCSDDHPKIIIRYYLNNNNLEYFDKYFFGTTTVDNQSFFKCYVATDGNACTGYDNTFIYVHSKIYDWSNPDKDITPSEYPTPFTVDYSPSLSEGMSRKGTLVAPGASNDGQKIESNGLNVRVTLTDEFIKLRDSYDELKDYTYEFVCYITTSPPDKSSYEDSVKNAVYTSLDYGKYMYTTSGVVDDVTDDNNEPTEWIKAEGINAGYIIGKGGKVKNVTINLENLDSSQFTADIKLYIVVYGRLTSLSVPTPDYFDLDNQGYLCNQGSLNTKQIVTVNADPETGEGTDVVMPDYYCVTSTAFNYKDYPEYKPKIFKNGAEMDTNKPFTDYLDKKLTPDYMYDYDMDKKGESGLAPDDFKKYEEQKKLDANFGSVDFGLDSIKSVFDGSSDFFKFLTASIGILPTTFLTILISFFVVMLAICVVKWVLK